MWRFVLVIAGFVFCGVVADAQNLENGLGGTWKIKPGAIEPGQENKDMVLLIEEKGTDIHIRETRSAEAKDGVSEFTCDTIGKECEMSDGGHKANVSVYYNGPVLVVLKTHGRKGSSVEKQRLSLSPAGDSLVVEVMHIEPAGRTEKLVFSKAQ